MKQLTNEQKEEVLHALDVVISMIEKNGLVEVGKTLDKSPLEVAQCYIDSMKKRERLTGDTE